MPNNLKNIPSKAVKSEIDTIIKECPVEKPPRKKSKCKRTFKYIFFKFKRVI